MRSRARDGSRLAGRNRIADSGKYDEIFDSFCLGDRGSIG